MSTTAQILKDTRSGMEKAVAQVVEALPVGARW